MINNLYKIQKDLNDRIIKEHNLNEQELEGDRYMALLVELGELANETRCFKYWSLKPPSEKAIILEEYSDVLHFLLTIGLSLDSPSLSFYNKETDKSLTDLFLSMYNDINIVRSLNSSFVFIRLFNTFMLIGQDLGFSEEEIYNSYLSKNKINHIRQDNDYWSAFKRDNLDNKRLGT